MEPTLMIRFYLSGNVPLHLVISCRPIRILNLLIENGASIDFKALDGATALIYAVSYKQMEMAEFLIENGANVKSTCSNLKTPLHFALHRVLEGLLTPPKNSPPLGHVFFDAKQHGEQCLIKSFCPEW